MQEREGLQAEEEVCGGEGPENEIDAQSLSTESEGSLRWEDLCMNNLQLSTSKLRFAQHRHRNSSTAATDSNVVLDCLRTT